NAVKRCESILPRDFLSFAVISAEVRNRNFVNTAAKLRDFSCNLRLKTESVFFDRHLCKQLAAERLVAGLHIREVQIGKHVREERQHSVAEGMPEEQHSMRAREETRTVNDIRPSRIDRLNQDSIFSRVIFKIGVLNDDDVACSCRYARAQCGTFALIDFMIE